MLVGAEPWSKVKGRWRVLSAVMDGTRPGLPAGAPPEVCELISACWAHKYEDRPIFSAIVAKLTGILEAAVPAAATAAAATAAAATAAAATAAATAAAAAADADAADADADLSELSAVESRLQVPSLTPSAVTGSSVESPDPSRSSGTGMREEEREER